MKRSIEYEGFGLVPENVQLISRRRKFESLWINVKGGHKYRRQKTRNDLKAYEGFISKRVVTYPANTEYEDSNIATMEDIKNELAFQRARARVMMTKSP